MVRTSSLLTAAAVGCAWYGSAAAESASFAGTAACMLESQHVLPAGLHHLGVEQLRCKWIRPLELSGERATDATATDTFEVAGKSEDFRGVLEIRMESGAQVSLLYRGTGPFEEGRAFAIKGEFTLADGTGRLKPIQGNGTFSCTLSTGAYECTIEGAYRPAPL